MLYEFWFKNYNWLWPLIPTWGDIKLTLKMDDTQGNKLFEKEYSGSGSSQCMTGQCGFENATKDAMTALLNQIVADFSSSEVRKVMEPIFQVTSAQ